MLITQRSSDDMLNDTRLASEMQDLLAPSYVDAGSLLKRELRVNTRGYLLRNDVAQLRAFFLVGHDVPSQIGGESTVYLGLSACRDEDKNLGLTIRLYWQFICDGHAWESEHGKRLRLWGTTAHPLVWSICRRIFNIEWPKEDGSYISEAAHMAWELRRQLPEHYQRGEHPFICRGAAMSTRYSTKEYERCEFARQKLTSDIFGQFEINERKGDRLLMLARLL